jgi:hypothetical protein
MSDDLAPLFNANELARLERMRLETPSVYEDIVAKRRAQFAPDLSQAERFLVALGGDFGCGFTFQTFDDDKSRKDARLARVLHGTLEQHAAALTELNARGAGIFVTVNETDLAGRGRNNVVAVRAAFADFDADGLNAAARAAAKLPPSITVASSNDKRHLYWLATMPLEQFTPMQEAIIAACDSDPQIKDLPRVMRLPGFFHRKGAPQRVRLLDAGGPRYAFTQLQEAFGVAAARTPDAAPPPDNAAWTRDREAERVPQEKRAASLLRLRTVMAHVPNDPSSSRDHWVKVAHALRNAAGREHESAAREMFLDWSRKWGEQDDAAEKLWRSILTGAYGEGSAGMGTLVRMAKDAGWDGTLPLDALLATTNAAVTELANDPGAVFADEAQVALRALQRQSPADYARIRERVKATRRVNLKQLEDTLKGADGGDAAPGPADALVDLARSRCTLLRNADNEGVAVVRGDPEMAMMVRSLAFKHWLRGAYFEQTGRGYADMTQDTALATIEAVAVFNGELVEVHRRFAFVDNAIYVDLCDERWRVAEVTAAGVRVLDASPVRFVRGKGMRPLPVPVAPAAPVTMESFNPLWRLVNVPADDRILVLALLVEWMRPSTPHPVLEIVSTHGAIKSTTQRLLRDLIDPNDVPLRGRPRDVEAIYVAAAGAYVASLENISYLPDEIQDALCVLATGGGLAKRKQYTDGDEVVIKGKAPVMMNGIAVTATRPDLIDRIVHLSLPAVEARMTEAEHAIAWAEAYPSAFGNLLALASAALRHLPDVVVDNLPRMADFAMMGCAVARALGLTDGHFLTRYRENLRGGMERGLESSSVGQVLPQFIEKQEGQRWRGTVGELYVALHLLARLDRHAEERFPRSPNGLGNALRRIIPALHVVGIKVTFGGRMRYGYEIEIVRAAGD